MEFNDYEELPADDHIRLTIERATAQLSTLQDSIQYNFITVQLLVDDNNNSVSVALVAHNPCNLNQYQVVAFLPTMDNSLETLKANELASKEVAKIEANMPDELRDHILELCMKRFSHASAHDPEAFIRIMAAKTFDDARAVYQEYFGLTEGGDFNHPLQ